MILLVLVAAAILTLMITGTVFVVAIPAFPSESIVIGLLVGVVRHKTDDSDRR